MAPGDARPGAPFRALFRARLGARSFAPVALVALVALTPALSSCQLFSGVTPCRHGEACPAGQTCSPTMGVCVAPGALSAGEGEGVPGDDVPGDGGSTSDGEGEGDVDAGNGGGSEGEGTGAGEGEGEGEGGAVDAGSTAGPGDDAGSGAVDAGTVPVDAGSAPHDAGFVDAGPQCPPNSTFNGSQCFCDPGFVPNAQRTGCVPATVGGCGGSCGGGCGAACGGCGGSCGGCGACGGCGCGGCGGCGCGGGEREPPAGPSRVHALGGHLLHEADELLLVETGGALVEATPARAFLVDGAGFVDAAELAPGDRLVSLVGPPVTVTSVSSLRGAFQERDPGAPDALDDGSFVVGPLAFVAEPVDER